MLENYRIAAAVLDVGHPVAFDDGGCLLSVGFSEIGIEGPDDVGADVKLTLTPTDWCGGGHGVQSATVGVIMPSRDHAVESLGRL